MSIVLWIVWVVICCYALMIVCDRFFVKSLDVIAKKWNMSDDIAWATIMAVGTSAPEFFTALMALFSWGKAGLWAGTIIGSAIFNILCIAWGSALFLNAVLKRGPFFRDAWFYAVFIGLVWRSFWDGKIVMLEAITYILVYILYIGYLVYQTKKRKKQDHMINIVAEEIEEIEEEVESKIPFVQIIDKTIALTYPADSLVEKRYTYVFWMSIAWIVFLSRVLVESGVLLAHGLGVSEVIIGLTVLAAGTSVPDLLSSLIVAKKWRGDMAVSNALGSNIFDIWICLWLPWLVYLAYTWDSFIPVSSSDLQVSIATLLWVLLLVVGVLVARKFHVNKYVWYIYIGAYILYVWRAIVSSIS